MMFRLLGPLTVSGSPVAGGPRVRALLALLLLDAGRAVAAGRLVDGLYGDTPPAGAASALQSQVSRLRRALPDGFDVEHSPAGYRLTAPGAGPGGGTGLGTAVSAEMVDVLLFERLAREGARAASAGEPVRAEALLREALELWRGPALADVQDAPYAPGQTARLDALRLDALEEWAAALLASGGDPTSLARELEAVSAAHPLRERLRALQIRALAGAGRQARALAAYEEVRAALADELGADPSPELAAAHLAVLRGERDAKSRPATARPLPAPLTEFIGRTPERERLRGLLAVARLVTLVGPGGAGKTRLALEGAREAAGVGTGAGGGRCDAVFVDVGAVGAGEAAGAFARALGVRDATPDALARALADRPVLLVVDNCEHVVAEVALLVRTLLTECLALRALATSREALGLTGESLLPLGALAPEAAVELFVRRGAAARPGFTGHPRVTDVCAALDGLPLALELAAARLRTLSVEELADRLGERLGGPWDGRRDPRPSGPPNGLPGGSPGGPLDDRDDRFRLLSRGDRTAPARHRTLAAVVEWSWELLDPAERRLAARFSVFQGGATSGAVASVCGVEHADAEDLLASLTEKSLMEAAVADGGAGPVRYRMLETVRAYAAGQLPAGDPAPAAHTAHFLALAREAEPALRGPDQLGRLALLDAEEPNLRAALRRAVAHAPEDALRLVAALTSYWWLRGLRGHVAGLATALLDVVERTVLDPAAAGLGEEYVLCALAANAPTAPTAPAAPTAPVPTDPAAAGGTRPDRLARARALLGSRVEPLRQPFTAFLWATTVGPEARLPVPDDAWSRALGQAGRGHLALERGDLETARAALTEALTGFRALGERWGTATALEGLAALSPDPLPLLGEALALFETLGVAEDIVDLLRRRAAVHEAAGDTGSAATDRARAALVARRAGLPTRA
ncbi:BTAD domain-containing putative transcriptional regulator [Streptomyces sp. NPDC046203]|uniref:ATP-binding protein n=1 Tax=Streptomyces sp. NPDC046203 TaxID=3154602 RepID=UPI0033EB59E1